MDENIQPSHATFEQSQLLAEKGFECNHSEEIFLMYPDGRQVNEEFLEKEFDMNLFPTLVKVKQPQQWEVIDWLESKYQKYVYAFRYNGTWEFKIDAEHGTDYFSRGKGYGSRKEAYSAAFDHVLKELT